MLLLLLLVVLVVVAGCSCCCWSCCYFVRCVVGGAGSRDGCMLRRGELDYISRVCTSSLSPSPLILNCLATWLPYCSSSVSGTLKPSWSNSHGSCGPPEPIAQEHRNLQVRPGWNSRKGSESGVVVVLSSDEVTSMTAKARDLAVPAAGDSRYPLSVDRIPSPHFIIRRHLSSPLTAGPRRICMQ